MSDLKEFQEQHGDEWQRITASPAFGAAMLLLNCEKIAAISALTPEDIEAKGKLVLADLVGHLNHENNLVTLSARKEFVFTEVREGYPDPVDEHAEEAGVQPEAPSPHLPPKKTTKKKR